MADKASQTVQAFTYHELSLLAWAFATAGVTHRGLFHCVGSQSAAKQKDIKSVAPLFRSPLTGYTLSPLQESRMPHADHI